MVVFDFEGLGQIRTYLAPELPSGSQRTEKHNLLIDRTIHAKRGGGSVFEYDEDGMGSNFGVYGVVSVDVLQF